jgi:hypothetical protein
MMGRGGGLGEGERLSFLSTILVRILSGLGLLSLLVSTILVLTLSSGGLGLLSRSLSIILSLTLTGGGLGLLSLSLSIILSLIRTGLGLLGLLSTGLVNVSVSLCLNTSGPASSRT